MVILYYTQSHVLSTEGGLAGNVCDVNTLRWRFCFVISSTWEEHSYDKFPRLNALNLFAEGLQVGRLISPKLEH